MSVELKYYATEGLKVKKTFHIFLNRKRGDISVSARKTSAYPRARWACICVASAVIFSNGSPSINQRPRRADLVSRTDYTMTPSAVARFIMETASFGTRLDEPTR